MRAGGRGKGVFSACHSAIARDLDLWLWDELSLGWYGEMLVPRCAPGSSGTGQEGEFPQC